MSAPSWEVIEGADWSICPSPTDRGSHSNTGARCRRREFLAQGWVIGPIAGSTHWAAPCNPGWPAIRSALACDRLSCRGVPARRASHVAPCSSWPSVPSLPHWLPSLEPVSCPVACLHRGQPFISRFRTSPPPSCSSFSPLHHQHTTLPFRPFPLPPFVVPLRAVAVVARHNFWFDHQNSPIASPFSRPAAQISPSKKHRTKKEALGRLTTKIHFNPCILLHISIRFVAVVCEPRHAGTQHTLIFFCRIGASFLRDQTPHRIASPTQLARRPACFFDSLTRVEHKAEPPLQRLVEEFC